MKYLLILFFTFGYVSCKIPDYIKICSRTDNQCLLDDFHAVVKHLSQNGEPAFKLQHLNEIQATKIPLQATKELQITLMDMHFHDLDTWDVKEFTMTDTSLHMRGLLPRFSYVGNYDMKGRILILPIQGQGTMNVTHGESTLNYKATLKTQERKGKKYYFVENIWEETNSTMENTKTMYFHFDNLFGGDPRLGPEMNLFLNDNWQDVFGEVKLTMEQFLTFILINPFVNGYLKHIPIDELFSD